MSTSDLLHADPIDLRSEPASVHSQLLRRGLAAIGLLVIAVAHVVDATGKFHETPYLGWAYVALILGCSVTAGALVERADRRAWMAAAAVSGLALAGYWLSRTTGLPAATDDIGNRFEPLGLVTISTEALVVMISARAMSQPMSTTTGDLGPERRR